METHLVALQREMLSRDTYAHITVYIDRVTLAIHIQRSHNVRCPIFSIVRRTMQRRTQATPYWSACLPLRIPHGAPWHQMEAEVRGCPGRSVQFGPLAPLWQPLPHTCLYIQVTLAGLERTKGKRERERFFFSWPGRKGQLTGMSHNVWGKPVEGTEILEGERGSTEVTPLSLSLLLSLHSPPHLSPWVLSLIIVALSLSCNCAVHPGTVWEQREQFNPGSNGPQNQILFHENMQLTPSCSLSSAAYLCHDTAHVA